MLCKELKIEIIRKLEIAKMYLEYLFPLLKVRQFHMNLTVETSCTHEGLVQNIGTVGCSQYDDT